MESSIAVFLMRQFACEQLPTLRRSLIMVVMWLTHAATSISGRFAAVVRSASLPIVLAFGLLSGGYVCHVNFR